MPDPDRDADPERRTDPRYDVWPVQRSDAYADWPVERATPRDEDGTLEEVAEEYDRERSADAEVIGFTGSGAQVTGPYVYGPGTGTVYQGEIDAENERIVLREEGEREVESEEFLGEHLEAIGDEHGWTWLSSFARDYLEDDDSDDSGGAATGLDLRDTEFTRRNVAESSRTDLSFTGSHTLVDESGRVHVVDRRFIVTECEGDRVAVEVEDDYLVAEEPAEERREGDADLVEQRQERFELDVDEAANRDAEVESYLKRWHAAHVGWPPGT